MIKKTHVKSFYNGIFVTCYEHKNVKYVANQHGDWDVYEGEYVRGERTRIIPKESDEIKNIINEYTKHHGGKR
ncbi:MAG TPA: hypothetical protein DHV16_04500 [Nitrospiraceae bacterium]|nr:MAG: hypothetical protein A2Z82_09270 [Nitrospirae bacterium GWA2_46_11]OGW24986.1 MAG: hypothetical protein A2X55_05945 [Nitrospirae bacterium GWB2_47_37]HAK88784.1 hypothetical protein [Nitrospiraceae bacterium]HCZ11509.1 hypothetical protein [Nitrospiraceae bacterium]